MEMLISLYNRTAHSTKTTSNWFADHGITVLNLPMGYCQEEDERHQIQQNRQAEDCYQSNLGFHNISAVPQVPPCYDELMQ